MCLCCFRVWGGNFCAPTGDIACLLLPGAEAAAAPPSPARALGCSFFSPGCIQTGSGCSALTFAEDWVSACRKPPAAILVKAADAAARPPSWPRFLLPGSPSRSSLVLRWWTLPGVFSEDDRGELGYSQSTCPEAICTGRLQMMPGPPSWQRKRRSPPEERREPRPLPA